MEKVSVLVRRCTQCKEEKDLDEFYIGQYQCKPCRRAITQVRREANREQVNAQAKRYRQRRDGEENRNFRAKVLNALSNGTPLCVRCGFTDIRALQIDHINGGGVQELKVVSSTDRVYRAILKNPDKTKYQILCANCNWIKRVENRECRRKVNGSL